MIRRVARPNPSLVGKTVGNGLCGILRGLLTALLILTGQQIASLPVGGPAVTEAVLCIGGGLVTVHLDAEGNPVGPAHLCPDATLCFLPDAASIRPIGAPCTVRTALWATPPVTPPTVRRISPPPATGPPVPV